ncbi:MAG: isoprenylcysteine carboxylmethyltransferase family protein [Nocardioides sp.]|uniref:methyltransferase family protein n=1 Tax=Nocardioides sp. TaxID=35761 RepID=UPI00326437D2
MKRPPPPLVALAAGFAQRTLSKGAPPPSFPRALVATATAGASIGLAAASVRQFRRHGTTVEPFEPSRAVVLVTTGVNAISRNPMYVGMAGLLVANAMRLGSSAALLPVAAFTVIIDRVQIAAEEPALLANFGAEYEAYRVSVPRWLDLRSVRIARGALR